MTAKTTAQGAHAKSDKTTSTESQADPADAEWAKLSQREKFIRTAREVGADETGKAPRAVGRARKR
jgi:hypothetical protein